MWLGAAVGRSAISKQAPVTLIAGCALLRRNRTAELANRIPSALGPSPWPTNCEPRCVLRSDVREEAFVKTGARRLRDFPDIHSASSAMAERHERVCGRSHSTPRRRIAPRRTSGCDLGPATDLDLDSLLPAGPVRAGPGCRWKPAKPPRPYERPRRGCCAVGARRASVSPADSVDIETDVEHGCLLKSMALGTAATGFQVTRLTEASFIVSTPRRAGKLEGPRCTSGLDMISYSLTGTTLP
jgi:hypothetical protein